MTREQRNRLKGCTPDGRAPRYGSNGEPVFDQKLIEVHPKRDDIYFATVDSSIIKAELNREISAVCPIAEDNRTVRREIFSNPKGAGWYYELHEPHSFVYPTTAKSAQDRIDRHFLREQRASVAVIANTGPVADTFPLAAA